MTTKEKIELEALRLFSTNGYAGVSIRDIAKKVDIKESSIYKHYKNKEAIFETIKTHYIEKTQSVFSSVSDIPSSYAGISKEILIHMMQTTFQSFAKDEYISKCRKLFMISAPGNVEIGRMYAQNFISQPIAFNKQIFEMLLQTSGKKNIDAESMAYQFYSPVFCILQEFDNGVLSMEESLQKIEKVTRIFMEVYEL